jgi:argininosuccinate lyase
LSPDDLLALDVESAVERRTVTGGTSRSAVQEQIARARDLIGKST